MNAAAENLKNRKLDVHEILTWLEEDEMVTADNAHMVRMLDGREKISVFDDGCIN